MPAQQRFTVRVAVYGLLTDNGRLLLMRRSGGYRNGEFGLPAGHLDGSEDVVGALIRELREELDIEVEREACTLVSTVHRAAESSADQEYIDLFFRVDQWAGRPRIAEPERCSELRWSDDPLNEPDLVDYIAAALRAIEEDDPMLSWGW